MIRKSILLLSLLLSSLFFLLIVIWLSGTPSPKNHFNRRFLKEKIVLKNSIRLSQNEFYVAGMSADHLWLANFDNTSLIFSASKNLEDPRYINLPTPDTGRIAWRILHIQIDSPDLWLMEGLTPTIIRTNLLFQHAERIKTISRNFTASVPLASGGLAIKTFDNALNQDILVEEPIVNHRQSPIHHLLQKQEDGRFSVDGMIVPTKDPNRVVYVYYYRNRWVCLDSNLQLQYQAQTIDTNQFAKLKIGRLAGEDKTMLLTPPPTINRKACAGKQYLLIVSGLRADNESWLNAKRNAVLDVYRLSDGTYYGSFYLNGLGSKRITGIGASGQHLAVVAGDELRIYRLPFNPI